MPEIAGEWMDDAKYKTVVDILMGRTDVRIDGRKSRRHCESVARRAVADVMAWSNAQAKMGIAKEAR